MTVPKAVREHLGVCEGEAVRFEIEEDGDVVIRRSGPKVSKADYEERLKKAIAWAQENVDWGGLGPDEYMDLIRDRPEI